MRKNILFGGNFFLFKPFLSFSLVLCWKGYLLALIFVGRASPAGMSTPHSRQRAVRCSWCLQSSGGWQVLSAPAVLAAAGAGHSSPPLQCLAMAALVAQASGSSSRLHCSFYLPQDKSRAVWDRDLSHMETCSRVLLCSVQGRSHKQPGQGGAMRFSLAVTPLSALVQVMQEMSV